MDWNFSHDILTAHEVNQNPLVSGKQILQKLVQKHPQLLVHGIDAVYQHVNFIRRLVNNRQPKYPKKYTQSMINILKNA